MLSRLWLGFADIYKLTVEAVEKVPNMLQVLRAAFIQAIEWCILKKKVMQLEEYQAKQKQKTSFGAISCFFLYAPDWPAIFVDCAVLDSSVNQHLKTNLL